MATKLPLANLPEDYLYQLLPAGLIDLDQRSLIEAVLGGYQDRLSDLRSYVSHLSDIISPVANFPQLEANVVLAVFTGPAGQTVTRSLDIEPDTPLAGDPALLVWAAGQLGLDPSEVTAAVYGTDLLRQVNLDTLSQLASTIGAVLYPGPAGEDQDTVRTRRQKLLESYFPRLRVKGTSSSVSTLGKLLGFTDVTVSPLWSRLAPHNPSDVGNLVNLGDLRARPAQYPAASLPDLKYDPTDYQDGPWYRWASPTLSLNPQDPGYWPTAVNHQQPFFTVSASGTLANPIPGYYELGGGNPNLPATADLSGPAGPAGLTLTAVAPGAGLNKVRIWVQDLTGSTSNLTALGQLSSIKYRSSYLAVGAAVNFGTQPVQPSPDLQKTPTLELDGTATSPYLPWSGGSGLSAVSLWPNPSGQMVAQVVPRTQAYGSQTQISAVDLSEARRQAAYLDDLRPATRRTYRREVGPGFSDTGGYAAYPSSYQMLTFASGTPPPQVYGGTLRPGIDAPLSPSLVSASGILNGTSSSIGNELSQGGAVSFAGAGFNGTYLSSNYTWSLTLTGTQAWGESVNLNFQSLGGSLEFEPSLFEKAAGTTALASRPDDLFDTPSSGSGYVAAIYDEYPWRRDPVFAGEALDLDTYLPGPAMDLEVVPAQLPYKVPSLAGASYELAVVDDEGPVPYRFKVLAGGDTDPVTGAALAQPWPRELLATGPAGASGSGLYHVLLVDQTVVAQSYWSPARWQGLVHWAPLNEHPYSPLDPHDRHASETRGDVSPTDRIYDSTFGWVLQLLNPANPGVVGSNILPPPPNLGGISTVVLTNGDSSPVISLSLWVNLLDSPTVPFTFLTLGPLALGVDTSANWTVAYVDDDVGPVTPTILTGSTTWQQILVTYDGATLAVWVNELTGGLTSPVFLSLAELTFSDLSVFMFGGPAPLYVHDLTVWDIVKSSGDLSALSNTANYLGSVTSVPYEVTYAENLRQDRHYALSLLPGGFAYPAPLDGIQVGRQPGYAVRYNLEAEYVGDDRFKQVGLGDGDQAQSTYQLGLAGILVTAEGDTLVSGLNPPLPGYNTVWSSGTVATWPLQDHVNPTEDRLYTVGDDGNVYKIYVDNLGSGPTLLATPTTRPRPTSETGDIPTFRDEPTDARYLLASSGHVLSVSVSGTVYTPYDKLNPSQTFSTGPAYLYDDSQVMVNAVAFSRWVNTNNYGTTLGLAALATTGSLQFINQEALSAGSYLLVVDCGNLGELDAGFTGFQVLVTVQDGQGNVQAQVASSLLANGKDTNPRGSTIVEMILPNALVGGWQLSFSWSNPLSVPSRGQTRSLVIYGYVMRLAEPELYAVSLNPLTLTPVNTEDTTTIYPGGVVARINSYGTVVRYDHEAEVVPTGSIWPLSNLETVSTWQRREHLYTNNPTLLPDPTPPAAPNIGTVTAGSQPYYNLGDSIPFSGSYTGTVSAFVWRFWDNTVVTTSTLSYVKVVGVGTVPANGSYTVTAVGADGQYAVYNGSLTVNNPPVPTVFSDHGYGVFPYPVNYTGAYTDPDGDTATLAWYDANHNLLASSSGLAYIATTDTVLELVATDTRGGVGVLNVAVEGKMRTPPTVSPILGPVVSSTGGTGVLQLEAYAVDTNLGQPVFFEWTFWDSTTATGTTTPVLGSAAYFNIVKKSLASTAPGLVNISLTVTDAGGSQTTVLTTVTLVPNSAPTISNIVVSARGVMAGQAASYYAVASDLDGDQLGYTWTFLTPAPATLLGGNVSYQTTSGQLGQTITGYLTVDDGNGNTAQLSLPSIIIANSSLHDITANPQPGFFVAGSPMNLTSPDSGVTIQYTLDGSPVVNSTDGTTYVAAFNFSAPTGGTGSVTLRARAFKSGSVPSNEFIGVYTFYNPAAPVTATIISSGSIPGDSGQVSPVPVATDVPLVDEPILPFSPLPPPGAPAIPHTESQSFVTLANPI